MAWRVSPPHGQASAGAWHAVDGWVTCGAGQGTRSRPGATTETFPQPPGLALWLLLECNGCLPAAIIAEGCLPEFWGNGLLGGMLQPLGGRNLCLFALLCRMFYAAQVAATVQWLARTLRCWNPAVPTGQVGRGPASSSLLLRLRPHQHLLRAGLAPGVGATHARCRQRQRTGAKPVAGWGCPTPPFRHLLRPCTLAVFASTTRTWPRCQGAAALSMPSCPGLPSSARIHTDLQLAGSELHLPSGGAVRSE
jgi:hypothetical protein